MLPNQSWLDYHLCSEKYAKWAEDFTGRQQHAEAAKFYRLAALAEVKALKSLNPSKIRTIGITAVSAVCLYFKGQDFIRAESLARELLSSSTLPPFAAKELKELVNNMPTKIEVFW